MANVYCVSYDLNGNEADYTGLYEELTSLKHWWHYLESTWLVVYEGTAEDLWERLSPHVSNPDRVLVIGVARDTQGLLPEKAWEWIAQNVEAVEAAV